MAVLVRAAARPFSPDCKPLPHPHRAAALRWHGDKGVPAVAVVAQVLRPSAETSEWIRGATGTAGGVCCAVVARALEVTRGRGSWGEGQLRRSVGRRDHAR